MITPSDIQNAEFAKSMKGYNQDEVDRFLDALTVDYENILNENERLKKEIEDLTSRLGDYKAQEGAVIRTLETAKSLMNDISASAEKRADILLKNAQLDAELQSRQASENVERLRAEEERLQKRVATVRMRFKSILEAELDRINDLTSDIFGEDIKSSSDAPTLAHEPAVPETAAEKTKINLGTKENIETKKVDLNDKDLFKTKVIAKGK